MGVLHQIVESKRSELPELRKRRLPTPPSTRPLLDLSQDPGARSDLRLICEIKRKSPSAGPLSRALSVAQRAAVYESAGAWLISVLCDNAFFDGSYEHLSDARSGSKLPLLCKEFILDECQLDAAAAYGASAVLLIARCLDGVRLGQLIEAAQERDLRPLVEVFTEEEARLALDSGATFVGVNSRDLDTLEVDTERASQIVGAFPPGVFVAQLSGVHAAKQVSALARSRADAALIGEVLMREDDPSDLLGTLLLAARRT